MDKKYYDITGMTCSACSAHVEKAARAVSGVESVQVNLLTNSMVVHGAVSESDIESAVQKAGYGAKAKSTSKKKNDKQKAHEERQKQLEEKQRQMHIRLWVSISFLVVLMYVSMGEMIGLPLPPFLDGMENAVSFGMAQFLLTLPIVYVNRAFFQKGFKALFNKSPNMDSLVAMGSSAALIYGVFAIMRMGTGLGTGNLELVHTYRMDLYFESAGTILTLITLGKYFEERSKGKTSSAITKLMQLAPQIATVIRDEIEVTIDVEDVQAGDIIVLRPGQSVPVDGVITKGHSSFQEAALTGESLPREKTIGENVLAGSINNSGLINFKATKVGEDTTIAQIIRLVEEATAGKAPIAKIADKISGVFVPVVMAIALVTAIVWLLLGMSAEFALSSAIAVLVISCPCALGLATPVAIMVGTGKGAEHGVLIKSGEALEKAHSITHLVLDKTGTVTKGEPIVTDIYCAQGDEWLSWAYGIEIGSEHPLASAVVNYAKQQGIKQTSVQDMQAVFGKGVKATLNGELILSGNEKLLNDHDIEISDNLKQRAQEYASSAKTPLYFAKNKQVCGIMAVADVIKPGAKQQIKQLKEMGLNITLLTGDNEKTAKAIGAQLEINDVIAQVLPHEKEGKISSLQKSGAIVGMVGDGTNDAPALARADVGIAIGAGTDIAIDSADIVLMKNSLSDVITALKLSKAVIRNIKQNLFWAFFYNMIGIPLAAGLLYLPFSLRLSPMFGAAAMSLSSIFVVTNALRLRKFKADSAAISELAQDSIAIEKGEEASTMAKSEIEDNNIDKNKQKGEKKTMNTLEINVGGMTCPHCVRHVKNALEAFEGVSADVILEENKAICQSEGQLDESALKKAVVDAGYTAD